MPKAVAATARNLADARLHMPKHDEQYRRRTVFTFHLVLTESAGVMCVREASLP
jgi:hypothetical protein